MAALARSAVVRVSKGSIAAALIAAASCGGDTPTSPATRPAVPVIVGVAPNPLKATVVRTEGGIVTFRIVADVTLSAATASGARINQVTTSASFTQDVEGFVLSLSVSESRSVSIDVPPSGTVTFVQTEEFGGGSGDTVTWRIEVKGVDAQGRSFTASSGNIPVEVATSTASISG